MVEYSLDRHNFCVDFDITGILVSLWFLALLSCAFKKVILFLKAAPRIVVVLHFKAQGCVLLLIWSIMLHGTCLLNIASLFLSHLWNDQFAGSFIVPVDWALHVSSRPSKHFRLIERRCSIASTVAILLLLMTLDRKDAAPMLVRRVITLSCDCLQACILLQQAGWEHSCTLTREDRLEGCWDTLGLELTLSWLTLSVLPERGVCLGLGHFRPLIALPLQLELLMVEVVTLSDAQLVLAWVDHTTMSHVHVGESLPVWIATLLKLNFATLLLIRL